MSKIESVLIEYTDDTNLITTSAILFDQRWILTPAASFILAYDNKPTIINTADQLDTSKLHLTNHLNLLQDNLKLYRTTHAVQSQTIQYTGMFSCNNIKATNDFFPLTCGDTNEFNSLLSLFLIFDLKLNWKFNIHELYNSIRILLNVCKHVIDRGVQVCVESSPFGSIELLNSYSRGIVCNCFGCNDCYVLIDASTAPGSEGAPVFALQNKSSKQIPIGIVVSSVNSWRGENTGLTLAATFVPLLSQLLPNKIAIKDYFLSNKDSLINTIDKSVVQVYCGNGWGTGLLINRNKGIFITNSHVVKNCATEPITLKWREKTCTCDLIYRTTGTNVYDIAVLKCSSKCIEQMVALKFAIKPALKGENVLAVGYPIFNSNDPVYPVVTKGNVSLAESYILHTTCCVLPGSSGGAILRANGELLAIIVCHTTITVNDNYAVYPKINMAIPIIAIKQPLISYIKTNNMASLKCLETNEVNIRNKWDLFRAKL